MPVRRYARGLLPVPLLAILSWSCGSGTSGDPSATGAPSTTAPATSGAARPPATPATPAASDDRASDDDVKPVYPQTTDPPDPVAQKYCDLIHETAETKRKECCPSVPVTPFRPTVECARTLSYALKSKALVLEKADLDGCEAAILAEARQCDWGGELPAACKDILKGQVKPSGACRSALECEPGLFCAGLGVSTAGKCAPPRAEGGRCSKAVDSLGAFVHQDTEARHPRCTGYCERGQCVRLSAPGEKCTSSVQCGRDQRCRDQKCSDAPLPKAGEACLGNLCEKGLRCAAGKCTAEKRIGEECGQSDECRSGRCDTTAGPKGRCAMSCEVLRSTPASTWRPQTAKGQ